MTNNISQKYAEIKRLEEEIAILSLDQKIDDLKYRLEMMKRKNDSLFGNQLGRGIGTLDLGQVRTNNQGYTVPAVSENYSSYNEKFSKLNGFNINGSNEIMFPNNVVVNTENKK